MKLLPPAVDISVCGHPSPDDDDDAAVLLLLLLVCDEHRQRIPSAGWCTVEL